MHQFRQFAPLGVHGRGLGVRRGLPPPPAEGAGRKSAGVVSARSLRQPEELGLPSLAGPALVRAPAFGDRKTYQMDYRTHDQGLEEIEADLEEGADWTMVKPALPYLDMIARAVERFPQVPMVAYQVSGEYAMLKAAASAGYLDEQRVVYESLIAIKRAGAQYIITYYAKEYQQRWA